MSGYGIYTNYLLILIKIKVYHIFYPVEVIFWAWLHIIESVQVTMI